MAEIEIPFMDRFKISMLSGFKVCTSRNKKYGEPEDTFWVWGNKFKLIAIVKFPLSYVKFYFFNIEGFETELEFMECWAKLHPKKGYDPEQLVWVHFFEKI